MSKRTILRAAILAALALSAIVLGFGAGDTVIVEIEALQQAEQTPGITASVSTTSPMTEEPSEMIEQEEASNTRAVTNRLGTLTIVFLGFILPSPLLR